MDTSAHELAIGGQRRNLRGTRPHPGRGATRARELLSRSVDQDRLDGFRLGVTTRPFDEYSMMKVAPARTSVTENPNGIGIGNLVTLVEHAGVVQEHTRLAGQPIHSVTPPVTFTTGAGDAPAPRS
jgi:hypothetical protein